MHSCFTALEVMYEYKYTVYVLNTDVVSVNNNAKITLLPKIKPKIIPNILLIIPKAIIKRIIRPSPLK